VIPTKEGLVFAMYFKRTIAEVAEITGEAMDAKSMNINKAHEKLGRGDKTPANKVGNELGIAITKEGMKECKKAAVVPEQAVQESGKDGMIECEKPAVAPEQAVQESGNESTDEATELALEARESTTLVAPLTGESDEQAVQESGKDGMIECEKRLWRRNKLFKSAATKSPARRLTWHWKLGRVRCSSPHWLGRVMH
jgi:hypothetical protein